MICISLYVPHCFFSRFSAYSIRTPDCSAFMLIPPSHLNVCSSCLFLGILSFSHLMIPAFCSPTYSFVPKTSPISAMPSVCKLCYGRP